MPPFSFFVMLLAVIAAAGVTIWLITQGGAAVMVAALPAFLIATVAVKVLRK